VSIATMKSVTGSKTIFEVIYSGEITKIPNLFPAYYGCN